MKIEQRKWTRAAGWTPAFNPADPTAQLALVFGDTALLKDPQLIAQIRQAYPGAQVMGCTTAGEICGTVVSDESVVVTAVTFEHSQIRGASVRLNEVAGSLQAGEKLAHALPKTIPGLNGGARLALPAL